MAISGVVRGSVVVLVAFLVLWLFIPAVEGFHVGYNAATDHECLTRVIQWCK
jgi:hypothetical protein